MRTGKYKNLTENLLSLADIELNGKRAWDIHIKDERFYKRVITEVELGMGESYMDNWWDCERPDEMIYKILRADLPGKIKRNFKIAIQLAGFSIINMQAKRRAFIIGKRHYDLGNDLFSCMLDKSMTYSCGYWENADSLDKAQENKLDLICRKISLKPGMRVLDIGCGWGSFAKFAAERYECNVVGITVSREQEIFAKKLCRGLPVEIRYQDYRDVKEIFDAIVSVGMIEHVGLRNYRKYFETANNNLRDSGIFLLHTIGEVRSTKNTDAWTHKYIFPNGMLPSIAQIGKAIEGLFVMEDWNNFGADYDRTLMAWYRNFNAGWDRLKDKYGERFYRMWKYFLLSSAGAFRARIKNQLWQIVLSKGGIPGGYISIR